MANPGQAERGKAYYFWRVLAVGCAVGLGILSLWPADELMRLGAAHVNDKVGHFSGYLLLAGLLGSGWPRRPLWQIWGATFLFGLLIEYAQSCTPSRQFEVLDMVANGAGALLAVTVLWIWRWRRAARA